MDSGVGYVRGRVSTLVTPNNWSNLLCLRSAPRLIQRCQIILDLLQCKHLKHEHLKVRSAMSLICSPSNMEMPNLFLRFGVKAHLRSAPLLLKEIRSGIKASLRSAPLLLREIRSANLTCYPTA
ncbi:hypothetical protein CXB51_016990 [Gossypium anomalum]|uniref:Uncharacterized protein n=1 Tax=Gossypium anomalum TaxID=47600 RepID=A0A8J5YEW9_9ROSI|nr:hypothetical protein CXB51_016990 [Gossypium anomalum]